MHSFLKNQDIGLFSKTPKHFIYSTLWLSRKQIQRGGISYTKARIAAYDLTIVSIIRLVEFPRLGVIGRRFEKKGFWAGVTGPSASVKDG